MAVSDAHPACHIPREGPTSTHRAGDRWAADPIRTPWRKEKRPPHLASIPDSPCRQERQVHSLVPISTELRIDLDVNLLLLGVKYGSFMCDSGLCEV